MGAGSSFGRVFSALTVWFRNGDDFALRSPALIGNKKAQVNQSLGLVFGGSCEIRTHGGDKPSPVFKTGALNRSAKLPFEGAIMTQLACFGGGSAGAFMASRAVGPARMALESPLAHCPVPAPL